MRLSRTLRCDETGVAGVVGIALMIAALVTLYSNAVTSGIPIQGAQAEAEWDEMLGETFRALSGSFTDALASDTPIAAGIPEPPRADVLSVPFLRDHEALPPAGSISFAPSCAALAASHTGIDGARIEDLRRGATGCIEFRSETLYSPNFGYRVEFGGVLRIQDDRAVVLSGPPLDLDATDPSTYRVTLGVPGLRGASSVVSVGASGARVDLIPGPHALETERAPNAGVIEWRLETRYPEAWRTWFEMRFDSADFVDSRPSPAPGESAADVMLTCVPVDCRVGPGGTGTLVVRIEGPRTDADDLRLSETYAVFDVEIH